MLVSLCDLIIMKFIHLITQNLLGVHTENEDYSYPEIVSHSSVLHSACTSCTCTSCSDLLQQFSKLEAILIAIFSVLPQTIHQENAMSKHFKTSITHFWSQLVFWYSWCFLSFSSFCDKSFNDPEEIPHWYQRNFSPALIHTMRSKNRRRLNR